MIAAKCIVALAMLLPVAASAAELAVSVSGVDGRAVSDAVVTLTRVDAAAAAEPQGAVIDQRGKQFAPWVTALPRGGELVFTNHDDITHHVYSFSPTRRFSFRLQPGERHAPLAVERDGVIVLGCNIHDWMVGYVYVSDADFSAITDAAGVARFAALPAGEWQVRMWHPGLERAKLPPAQTVRLNDDTRPAFRLAIRLGSPLSVTGPREPLDDSGYASP